LAVVVACVDKGTKFFFNFSWWSKLEKGYVTDLGSQDQRFLLFRPRALKKKSMVFAYCTSGAVVSVFLSSITT